MEKEYNPVGDLYNIILLASRGGNSPYNPNPHKIE